jgi:hypothetical protein
MTQARFRIAEGSRLRIIEGGRPCCSTVNGRGEHGDPQHPCPKCERHYKRLMREDADAKRQAEAKQREDAVAAEQANENAIRAFTPPNPYALRAAETTPPDADAFETTWKADRTLELKLTRAALDASPALRLTTLTAAELRPFAPPDPYREGIKALQSKETR